MTWIYENLIALIAMTFSIAAFIITQRNISKRVRADALKQIKGEMVLMNEKLEAEIGKLEKGLESCIRERVKFKEEIMSLKESLKLTKELKDGQE